MMQISHWTGVSRFIGPLSMSAVGEQFLEAFLLFLALEERNAFFHPLGFGRALEVVVEKLLHAHGPVHLVVAAAEKVVNQKIAG